MVTDNKIKLTITADSLSDLMDELMTEIPQMYVDFHTNKKSGGNKLKWEIEDGVRN